MATKVLLVMTRILLLSATSAATILLSGCLPSPCANQQLAEHLSPDNRMKVIVFERDCGATTGFSTHASLLPRTAVLENEVGNIFVADMDPAKYLSNPARAPELHVKWLTSDRVTLAHHSEARVVVAETKRGGVTVLHETFE